MILPHPDFEIVASADMTTMMKPCLSLLILVVLPCVSTACVATRDLGGDSGGSSDTQSDTGEDGTQSTSTSPTDDAGETDGSGTSSGSGSGSDSDDCSPAELCDSLTCPEECTEAVECSEFIIQCRCECPSSCDIEDTACEVAEQSKTAAVECGVVTLDDDLATWQAAHACVLDNASTSTAFKVVFQEQGIDTLPLTAYVGGVGLVYALVELRQDLGEVPGVTTVRQASCSALTERPDCTVGPGQHCILCEDSEQEAPACGP